MPTKLKLALSSVHVTFGKPVLFEIKLAVMPVGPLVFGAKVVLLNVIFGFGVALLVNELAVTAPLVKVPLNTDHDGLANVPVARYSR